MNSLHKNREVCTKMTSSAQKWQDKKRFGEKSKIGVNFQRKPKRKLEKEKDKPYFMTVCIAALCDGGKNAIGFTDSMMTVNQIETESVTKIIPLVRSVIALLSGDVDINTEILYRIRQILGEYDAENMIPYQHNVKDIATLYRDIYLQIRSEKIEKEIISLYGLDLNVWTTQQNTLSPDLVRDIINRIEYFDMPKIEVIIMGADKSLSDEASAHIFVVRNDEVICRDLIGYACVGAGGEQAELEFIQNGHSSKQSFEQAILTASLAKTRAESVAGVGKETKIAIIIDDESELAKSGTLLNGLFLQRLNIAEYVKTMRDYFTNRDVRKMMASFIEQVRNNQIDEIAEYHKKFMEKVTKHSTELDSILNEKPSLKD